MFKIKYLYIKMLSKIFKKNKELISNYFRRGGAKIGIGCTICSNLDLCDKTLLDIGDNVIISSDVLFVTHDASFTLLGDKTRSLFGKIIIGDNCFIGERATILYGVELAPNIIVGAGSVVTKSFLESGSIIAGNPACVVSNIAKYESKYKDNGLLLSEISDLSNTKLIKR